MRLCKLKYPPLRPRAYVKFAETDIIFHMFAWFRAIFCGWVFAGCWSCGTDQADEPRPRTPVILVSLDTLRADRLGAFGGGPTVSPMLDQLANEGVVFTDCLSQSSNTGPAHRSLFSGQFVQRHDHDIGRYRQAPYSMAGELKRVGYETVGFVGGGFLHPDLGFGHGFDTYVVENDKQGGKRQRRGFRGIIPQARRWWEQRTAEGPFFLFLHSYDIHCPFWPGQPWRDRFHGGYAGSLKLQGVCGQEAFSQLFLERPKLDPEDQAFLDRMYDGGIAMTDTLLGRFLQSLQETGVLDRSILIVTSDHGESLGEHAMIGHNRMWEEQLQIPLFIRFPNQEFAGLRIDEPTMLVDVFPTVLDYLGLKSPEGVQGESLMPVIRKQKTWRSQGMAEEGVEFIRYRTARHAQFSSHRFDNRWKFNLEGLEDGSVSVELYDLVNDPGEVQNLMATPEGETRYEAFLREYAKWQEQNANQDERYRGPLLSDVISQQLSTELDELGYSGFDEEDE